MQVFSKARAVIVDSRKSFSDMGFFARPYAEQSACVQKVGMMIIFAPLAINSRNASGKARSQQMSMPTGPRGVWIVSCGACVEEVRWGRSGCLRRGR